MSLRDFDSSLDDGPITLSHTPLGNGMGLGAFHTTNPQTRESGNTPKIVGALVVALMVGAAGAYIYSVTPSTPKLAVSDNKLPSPSAPIPT